MLVNFVRGSFFFCFVCTDLDWLFEMDVEGVARPVRKELGVILCKHTAQSLQLNADTVVSRAVRGAIKAESDNEDALINAELNRVTAATIAPLIATVGR